MRRDAPLEKPPSLASPSLPSDRDQSVLTVDDWLGFGDPDSDTYRTYVTGNGDSETIEGRTLEYRAAARRDEELEPGWSTTLAALFAPVRFPFVGLEICTASLGRMAPSSYIANCADLDAAGLLRWVTHVVHRTGELERTHPNLGFGTKDRQRWEEHTAWQGARQAIELALTVSDWGESFAAVNLVLRPTLDDVWLRQLGEAARANGDDRTWRLLSNLFIDAKGCRRWSAALAAYAVRSRPENAAVLRRWIDEWAPRADEAVAALAPVLATMPEHHRSEADICDGARAARSALLAEVGLADA